MMMWSMDVAAHASSVLATVTAALTSMLKASSSFWHTMYWTQQKPAAGRTQIEYLL